MLDESTRALWHKAASRGTPPPLLEYARIGLGLQTPWHWVDHFFPCISSIRPGGPKHRFAREVARDHGKSFLTYVMVLYAAEFVLPYLGVSKINQRIYLIGRNEQHVHSEIMENLHDFIANHAPWLKLPNWAQVWEEGGPEAIKAAMPKNFNKSQFDLTNGISIRGRSIKQGIRGAHVYLVVIDDLIDEDNWTFSHSFEDRIGRAIMKAIRPGGTLLCLGTPQADGDLLDLLRVDPQWDYHSLPAESTSYPDRNTLAIKQGLLPPTSITCAQDLTCLWPWQYNWAALQEDRGSTDASSLRYAREMLLQRFADEDSLVTLSDIRAAKDPTLHYISSRQPGEHYGGGIDPSSLRKDDAVIAIGTRDSSGHRIPRHIRILKARGKKAGPTPELEVISALNDVSVAFGNPPINLESNSYQGVIKPFAEKLLNPNISLHPVHLGANKHTDAGWLMLRNLFRNRRILLPYGPTPAEQRRIDAGHLDPADIEARRITDIIEQQLLNLRIDERGRIINANPNIHDDVVSALFLMAKRLETAGASDLVTSSPIPSSLPSRPPPPRPTAELAHRQPATTPNDRLLRAQRATSRRYR